MTNEPVFLIEEVEVYRSSQSMELIKIPASLSGEDILPGFVLDLTEII